MWTVAANAFVAWRDGDPTGLARMVHALTPMLWQVVRSYGLSRPAAEDAVQVTWLMLVRNRDAIRDPQAVWRWMATTARREAWRMARQAGPDEAVELESLFDIPEPNPGPEARAMADDTARWLWRHVASLPQRCRQLLRIIAFEDRPNYAEVSAQLGMSIGGIGPTRARCLDRLRRLIADDAGRSN